jgi:hypothetical protein
MDRLQQVATAKDYLTSVRGFYIIIFLCSV